MTNTADREKSLVWPWIIEYIASFPQINISLLHEIVDSCPRPPGDLPENVVEMVALRSLEQLFGPSLDDGLCSNNQIDLSLRCIDVLSSIVSEQMTLLELSEQSKRDIRLFIRHKRDSMPQCALEKLKGRILNATLPCAASGHGRVVSKDEKHDRNAKGNSSCNELVRFCVSSSQDQTKVPQLLLGELGVRNFLPFKRFRGESCSNKFSKDFHENLDRLNGGVQVDGRSKRLKLGCLCITQSTEQNSFHLPSKDVIEHSLKQITDLAEKETEAMELETFEKEAFHVDENQVEKETKVLDLETSKKELLVEETRVLDMETAEKESEVLELESSEKEEFHVEENPVKRETEMLDLQTSEKEFHVEEAEVLDVETAEKEEFQMDLGAQQTEHDDILCGQKDSSRRSRGENLPSKIHGSVCLEMERSNQTNGEGETFNEHHVVKSKGDKHQVMLEAQCTQSRQEEPNITGRETEVMISSIRSLKKQLKKKADTRLSRKHDINLRSNGGNGYPPAVLENESLQDVGCDRASGKVIGDNNLRRDRGNGYPPAVQEDGSLQDVECHQANSKVIDDSNLRNDGGNVYPSAVLENGSPLDVGCVHTNSKVIGDHHTCTKEDNRQPQESGSLSKQCRQGEPDLIGAGLREKVPSPWGLGLSTSIQIRIDQLKERIGMSQRKNDCKSRSTSPKVQETAKLEKVGCEQEICEICGCNNMLNRERKKQLDGAEAPCIQGNQEESDITSRKEDARVPFVRRLGTIGLEEHLVDLDSKLINDTLICKSKEIMSVTVEKGREGLQEGLKQQNLGPLEEQEHSNPINTQKRDSSNGESDESIISNYPIRVRMKRRRCKYKNVPHLRQTKVQDG